MVFYECPRCDYCTDHKTSILKHLNKKILCKIVKLDVIPIDYVNEVIDSVNISEYIKIKLKLDKINIENENLKSEIIRLKNLTEKNNIELSHVGESNIINGSYNNIINATYNITINNYNEPNMEYITEEHYRKFMKDMPTSYLSMCRELYFNPSHPENSSIHKTNIKNKLIKYYHNGEWKDGNEDTVIPEILECVYEALDKGSTDDKLTELLNKIDSDKDLFKKITKDIIIECYSNRPDK